MRVQIPQMLICVALFLGFSSLAYAESFIEETISYISGGCSCDAKDSCGCEDSCCASSDCCLLRFLKPSDTCFSQYISPMTNPVFFEDPRTLTEARFIFLRNRDPSAVAGGGDINLFALQLRAALTEDLSVIATKDGFITSHGGVHNLIDDGWADVALGLKYNLIKNYETQTIVSVGLLYELSVGSTRSLQGQGDGLFSPFLTAAFDFNGWHFMTEPGFMLPTNHNEESTVFFWDFHLDHRVAATDFFVLGEINWFNWLGAGNNGIDGVEGIDLFNFGSTGVAGDNVVTGALGVKYRPSFYTEVGFCWETPLTDRRFVMEYRYMVDVIVRY